MDLNKIKFIKSPNSSKRTDSVKCIVLHHTGSDSFKGSVSWLCDKQAQASAHFIIDLDGTINQLVKTEDSAWHAGKSEWTINGNKIIGLNNCSIGIEIVNIGLLIKGSDGKFYYEVGRNLKEWKGTTPKFSKIIYPNGKVLEGYGVEYPEKQINAVVDLCKALIVKYPNIKKEHILTHFQIAGERKNDPFCLDISDIIEKIYKK